MRQPICVTLIFVLLGLSSVCRAQAIAGTVAAQYNFGNFVFNPQAVRKMSIAPQFQVTASGTNIVTADPVSFTVGIGGSLIVSNILTGYGYTVTFFGNNVLTVFTNYFPTNISGLVNAKDYMIPSGFLAPGFWNLNNASNLPPGGISTNGGGIGWVLTVSNSGAVWLPLPTFRTTVTSSNASLTVSPSTNILGAVNYDLSAPTNSGASLQQVTNTISGYGNVIFQNATNFLTRNCRFVDAGNGSDANNGTANFPWATVAHAQQNTPNGWTIVAAPGTYAGMATNILVNWFLSYGATVEFSFVGGGTNNIFGDGIVQFGGNFGDTLDSFSEGVAIYCDTFDTVTYGDIFVHQNTFLNCHCRSALISLDGQIDNPTNQFNVYASESIYVSGGIGGGDSNVTIELHAGSSITFSDTGFQTEQFTTNSVVEAPFATEAADTIGTGTAYINCLWKVGKYLGNASDSFSAITFSGNPELAPTGIAPASNCHGPYWTP